LPFNLAASNTNEDLTFYEFPTKYSEYNSFDIEQFKDSDWFKSNKPISHIVRCETLDKLIHNNKILPKIIKIDVEGAEFKVISGLTEFLNSSNCFLAMEYLAHFRSNTEHQKAKNLLEEKNFKCHLINANGELITTNDVDSYLKVNNLESDNLVFVKV